MAVNGEGKRGWGGQRLTDIHTEATEAGSERKTFPPFLLPDTLSDVEKDINIWGKGQKVTRFTRPKSDFLLMGTLDGFGDFKQSSGR